MSFRRAVVSNVAVQAIGPASSFLTVLIIARLGGASDQGEYAQFRAWVDLMAALGCFGFPQGFIYVINKLRSSPSVLAKWSRIYSLAFVPVALLGCAVALRLGVLRSTHFDSVVLLALAAAMLVLHGLWRGIFLTHDAGVPFAVFTILPAVSLLVGCSGAMLTGSRRFDWAILLSMAATVAVSAAMMRPILGGATARRYRDQPWRALLSNGSHAFAQAMLLTLQPIVAYWLVRFEGGGNREIGFLNAGLFLAQGLSVPISMVAPLLFAQWTSVTDERLIERLHALTFRALALGTAAGVILVLAAAAVVPRLFGHEYVSAVAPVQAMLFTVPLLCHVRVIEPALHSRGRPELNTVAGAVRLVTFAVAGLLLPRSTENFLLAIGAAWTIANAVAGAWTLLALRSLVQDRVLGTTSECR